MEKLEENKFKKKRKLSIITVFLWLFLVVIMSVITIGGIRKQNAVESTVDKVTIKLDMSQLDEEILNVYIPKIDVERLVTCETESGVEQKLKYVGNENNIYIYELEEISTEDFKISMVGMFDYYENEILLETESQNLQIIYYKKVKVEDLQSEYVFEVRGEKLEVNFTGGFPMMILGTDLSLDLAENRNIITMMLKVDHSNNGHRYLGVRTSLLKSLIIASRYEVYEDDNLLLGEDGAYIKELSDSNTYHFNIKIEAGTSIHVNLTSYESLSQFLRIINDSFIFCDKDLNPIDIGDMKILTDSLNSLEISVIFPEYLSEEVQYLMLHQEKLLANSVYIFDINGEKICYDQLIDLQGLIKPNEYNEIYLTFKSYLTEEIESVDRNTYATQKIKWIDENTGKAELILGNTSCLEFNGISFYMGHEAVYTQVLDDQFVLSSEYENNIKWKIVDRVSSEEEVKNLFREDISRRYIYVKDSNTIYWKYYISDFEVQSEPIYVYYKNYDQVNDQKEILNSHKKSQLVTKELLEEKYLVELTSPTLGFKHNEERDVIIQKFADDGVYYVGLFTDDILTEVNKLEVKNNSGSVQIKIKDYDENKHYAIYEVDEVGNKVEEEAYLVEFLDHYAIRNAEITSDQQIISSIKSGIINASKDKFQALIDESEGMGEEYYVGNMLSVTDIYQAKVTIGEIIYKITYEADENGTLEGETEEFVKDGDSIHHIPTPVPNEGYEFDKWIVIENGEEIEVDLNVYVPVKDITFIAKFKPIEKIVDVDTSDVQVWIYIGVVVIATIVMVITISVIIKNKRKQKNDK